MPVYNDGIRLAHLRRCNKLQRTVKSHKTRGHDGQCKASASRSARRGVFADPPPMSDGGVAEEDEASIWLARYLESHLLVYVRIHRLLQTDMIAFLRGQSEG